MPNFVKKISKIFLFLALSLILILPSNSAFAIPNPYDGVRSVSWDSSEHRCNASGLEFDPFSPDNKDITWEYDNGTCLSYYAAAGITVATAEKLSSSACGYAENIVAVSTQMAIKVVLSPMTIVRRIQETNRCLLFSHSFPTCCFSTLGSSIAMGVAVGQLAAIHSTAQGAFDTAKICGAGWYDWAEIDEAGEEMSGTGKWAQGAYAKSRKKCLKQLFTNEDGANDCGINSSEATFSLSNKLFREYIYGGKEYTDNGVGECKNPWNREKRLELLGYDSDTQKYYMTGPGNASNYACTRFLATDQTDSDAQAAYDCCLKRSQNTICIENRQTFDGKPVVGSKTEKIFCEIGKRCNVGGVWFDTYQAKTSNNYICAKTYSVCPYNHPLGGGTEKESYDDDDELRNFCQVMNHCVKVPIKPYVRFSNFDSAFISSSCRDLKGDTQNLYNFDRNILIGSRKNFSAPMAQCFKETLHNMFLNKAGISKCEDPAEIPNDEGVCLSGKYEYEQGEGLDEDTHPSFFLKIQSALRLIIQLALSFSVIGLGIMVMLGMSPLTKKQILSYLAKLALVIFFAVGSGWQHGFVDGVLNSSADLSEMVFQIDETAPDNELDGCQFPRINYADTDPATMHINPSYPPGKEYLRIWDTLDCKLARAIGFGPGDPVPHVILMILGGFLTGGLGIIFFIASITMAFFLFSIIVRALHIFIMSVTAIVILLYISPITITLAMFNRTKGIFQGWWKQILGYILQPVILFLYLALFITFFDKILIGGARFEPSIDGGPKKMVCTGEAKDTSLYCIFHISKVEKHPGLEVIGVGLPILKDMNHTKLITVSKSALMLFVFLSFLDQISKFSKELVGGGLSDGWKTSFTKIAGKGYKLTRGVQKRANRGIIKGLKATPGAARGVARWSSGAKRKR